MSDADKKMLQEARHLLEVDLRFCITNVILFFTAIQEFQEFPEKRKRCMANLDRSITLMRDVLDDWTRSLKAYEQNAQSAEKPADTSAAITPDMMS
jgi:hypothetical protein